jgi:1-acyl-sn-glycerol-3-phosphate acyltransferase
MEDRNLFYRFTQWMARLVSILLWRYRCFGLDRVPRSGGLIVVANHQSLLDLSLLGCAIPRTLTYLARSTLRSSRIYRLLTAPFDVLDLRRGEGDVAAARQMVERLRGGATILLFPEGTRTRTGALGKLSPGFLMLAEKSGAKVVAARLEGAHRVWPRGRMLPGPGSIRLVVSGPLPLAARSRVEALELVRRVLTPPRPA